MRKVWSFFQPTVVLVVGLASPIAIFFDGLWGKALYTAIATFALALRAGQWYNDREKKKYEGLFSKCQRDKGYFYSYALGEVSVGIAKLVYGLVLLLFSVLLLFAYSLISEDTSNTTKIAILVVFSVAYLSGVITFPTGFDHLARVKKLASDVLGKDSQQSELLKPRGELQT